MNLIKALLNFSLLITPNLIFAVTPQERYIFDEFNVDKNYVQPVSKTSRTLSSNSTAIQVSINTANTIAKVRSTQFGVNTTFRNGSDQRTRSSLYNGKVTSLRFPAGSGSNTYFFDGNIPASMNQYVDNTGTNQSVNGINGINSTYLTPENFINFKRDVNGQAIVVINYFYARYGITAAGTRASRVQQAADYAASFVHKLNIELGGNVKFWEIGNECYGAWEAGYKMLDSSIGTVTGTEYGQDFNVFVQAMKAVDPTIKCGVILTDDAGINWNSQVLPQVKNYADFISVHQYFTTQADAANYNNILSSSSEISAAKSRIESDIVQYTGKAADYYPVVLTEFNARGSYNCSMINGVFISQILGEIIKNNYGLSSLWVSEWKWDATAKESMGFLAKSDPDQDEYSARQAYIPYYYYAKCFGNNMIESSSNNSNIVSYASTFSSGEIGLVLINKSESTQNLKLNVTNGAESFIPKSLDWYEFYANTIDLNNAQYKKFYINDSTSSTNGGGPANPDNIKPYFSLYDESKSITLKPFSVIYMVIKSADMNDGPITPQNMKSMLGRGFDVSWAEFNKNINAYSVTEVKALAARGFKNARIRTALPADATLFTYLDRSVTDCLNNGIIPIIAHNCNTYELDPSAANLKSDSLWWAAVADHFRYTSHKLIFDINIEWSDVAGKDANLVNAYYAKITPGIRASNPNRIIVYSPIKLSAPEYLNQMTIPASAGTYKMAEWHLYASGPSPDPASPKYWSTGTPAEKQVITDKMNTGLAWEQSSGIPCWVGAWMTGDFGTGNNGVTFSAARQSVFAQFMVSEFNRIGVPWSANCDDNYYDIINNKWIDSMKVVLNVLSPVSDPDIFNPPVLNSPNNNTVDNSISINFTDDSAWRNAITAITANGQTLTNQSFLISQGNITLDPAYSVILQSPGEKTIIIVADSYYNDTIILNVNTGQPDFANSTVNISSPLTPNSIRTIDCLLKDKYNNPVSGYGLKCRITVVNNDAVTTEIYTVDGNNISASANINLSTLTDAGGLCTFNCSVPPTVDGGDGISVQIKLNDAVVSIGSAFSYSNNSFTIRTSRLASVCNFTSAADITVTPSGFLDFDIPSTVNTITILSGGKVTNNSLLDVSAMNIFSNSAGIGTFIDHGTANITIANIQQYLAGGRNWYISSPLANATSSVFGISNLNNKLFRYDEAHANTQAWQQILNDNELLVPLKGYVANMENDGQISFSGILNNGNKIIELNRTAGQVKEGFNLVGNPFTAYLDWDNVNKTNISSTFWQRTRNITNSGNESKLRLQISNGVNTDETLIYSRLSASDNFDNYDSGKMFNETTSFPELFTVAGGQELAINGLHSIPYNTEIPLGISIVDIGNNTYTIKVSQITNCIPGTRIILNDYNIQGNTVTTDITTGDGYTFTSDAIKSTERFTIIFRANATYVFDTYNSAGKIGTNNNGGGSVNNHIPPLQAFWVRVSEGNNNGSLAMNFNMCSHKGNQLTEFGTVTDGIFKIRAINNSGNRPLLRIKVSNGINTDETILYFDENASDSPDSYDSPKLTNNNNTIPEIYSFAGTEEMVINGMKQYDLQTIIPLGFKTGESNTFTISASQSVNFDPDTRIILKDNFNGTETNLSAAESYSFISDATTTDTRFNIMFKSASGTTELNSENSKFTVYGSTGEILIDFNHKIDERTSVRIFNGVGQLIYSDRITEQLTRIKKDFIPGIYWVKIENGNHTKTEKIKI